MWTTIEYEMSWDLIDAAIDNALLHELVGLAEMMEAPE